MVESEPVIEQRDGHTVRRFTIERPLEDGTSALVEFESVDWTKPVALVRAVRADQTSARGVTAETLRKLEVFRLTRYADGCLGVWLGKHEVSVHGKLVKEIVGLPRLTRPRRPDEDFLDVALLYIEALQENPRKPYGEMSKYTRRDTTANWLRMSSEARLRKLVHECRHRDLLTHTRPGKAEGELTRYARRLLAKRKRLRG
jgi:hypothetical protein